MSREADVCEVILERMDENEKNMYFSDGSACTADLMLQNGNA